MSTPRKYLTRGAMALTGLGLAVLAGLAISFLGSAFQPAPATVGSAGEPGNAVVCQGHVDVEKGVTSLSPVQPGRVVEVLVREGQTVRRGAVLLRLEDAQATCLVRQAEGELRAAEARRTLARPLPEQHQADLAAQAADVKAAGHRVAAARPRLQRSRRLLRNGLLSDEEVTAAEEQLAELEAVRHAGQEKYRKLTLLQPQAQVALAEAEVAARQARLEEARDALEQCSLRAPADGTVLRLLAAAGDTLGPTARQPALLFCPDQPRLVRAEVPQEFADRVAVGQAVLIQDDARLVEVGRGRVARLSDWFSQRRSVLQEPTQRNDVRTLECLIQVDQARSPLRIGQRVRVFIGGGRSAEVEAKAGGAMSGARELVSYNPATGAELGRVPVHTPEEVQEAVARAPDAQQGWGRRTVAERMRALRPLQDPLVRHADDLARLPVAEQGKTQVEAYGEVLAVLDLLRYYRGPADAHQAGQGRRIESVAARTVVYHGKDVLLTKPMTGKSGQGPW